MEATAEQWADLVAQFEAAQAKADRAFEEYDRRPVSPGATPEEAAYERLRDVSYACEDRLLEVVAPDLAGVALQLRILGWRHFSAELGEDPMPNEDRDAAALRNVYAAISSR